MMTDPIADMLTRLRNALLSGKKEVRLPFSKMKFAIGQILEKEGYLEKAARDTTAKWNDELYLVLKYNKDKEPIIHGLKKISKSGCRIYVMKEKLPRVLSGYGLAIISTSKGVMTNKEAKKQSLGGEVICEVW